MKHSLRSWSLVLSILAIGVPTAVMVGTAFLQAPRPPVTAFPWYFVDDGDRGFSQTGRWNILRGEGFGGFAFDQRTVLGRDTSWIDYDPGLATARWTIRVQKPGLYDVFVSWKAPPAADADKLAPFASYVVTHAAGRAIVEVDQSVEPEGEEFGGLVVTPDGSRVRQRRPFQLLGTYMLGSSMSVELSNVGVDGGIIADSMFIRPAKQADLQLSETVGDPRILRPQDYRPGSPMRYNFIAYNRGIAPATKVAMTGSLPAEFVPATRIDRRCKITGRSLRCAFPGIAVRKRVAVAIPGRVSQTAVCDTQMQSVSEVAATERDPDMRNNTAQVMVRLCRGYTGSAGSASSSASVLTDPNGADLGAAVSANVATVTPGGEVHYTITIRNRGGADAKDVGVNISVGPFWEELAYLSDARCSSNGGNIYCRFDLARGASTVITYSTRMKSVLTCMGASLSVVDVRSPLRDPNENDNRALLSLQRDCPENPYVSISMAGTPANPSPGGDVAFTTTVHNHGTNVDVSRVGDARDIRIRVKFPCFAFRGVCDNGAWQSLGLVSTDPRCTADAQTKDMICSVPVLKWGEKAEFTQRVRIERTSCDGHRLQASYEVLGKAPNVTIAPVNGAAVDIGIDCADVRGDIELKALTPQTTVPLQGVITHRFQVTNKGQKTSDLWLLTSRAPGTTVDGTLQGCVQSVISSATFGCYLGAVNPGAVKTVAFQFRSTAACNAVHQANSALRFGGANEDQDLSNNSVSTSTTVTCN